MFKGVQLASEYKGFQGQSIIEPKIDGYRMVAIIGRNGAVLYSRSGRSTPYNDTLSFLAKEIDSLRLPFGSMLDGEIVVSDWNSTAIIKKTKATKADRDRLMSDVAYYVFDLVTPGSRESLYQRKQLLARFLPGPVGHISQVPWFAANSEADVRVFTAAMLQRGYEGSIVKDPAAPYSFTRSSSWQKIKQHRTFEVMPVGYIRGTGKYSNTLGAIDVIDQAGNRFKIGTGFTDAQRNDLWRRKPMGVPIEVSVQDSDVSKFRHPSFVRFRADLDVEGKNPTRKPAGVSAAAKKAAADAELYNAAVIKRLMANKSCDDHHAKAVIGISKSLDVEPEDIESVLLGCSDVGIQDAVETVLERSYGPKEIGDILSEESIYAMGVIGELDAERVRYVDDAERAKDITANLWRTRFPYKPAARIVLAPFDRRYASYKKIMSALSPVLRRDNDGRALAMSIVLISGERSDWVDFAAKTLASSRPTTIKGAIRRLSSASLSRDKYTVLSEAPILRSMALLGSETAKLLLRDMFAWKR